MGPRQAWARASLVIGLTLPLIPVIYLVSGEIGPVGTALVALPVALAGWFFGIGGGVAGSLLGVLLVTFLLTRLTGESWGYWLLAGSPGNLMLFGVGIISGWVNKGYAERQRIVDELRTRERSLSLLNLTIRDILIPREPGEMYFYLVNHLANLFVADCADLVRWDPQKERAALAASTAPAGQSSAGIFLESDEATFATAVIRSGQVLAVEDVAKTDYSINLETFSGTPAQSVIGIPLVAREYRFGAAILAFGACRRFTPQEVRFAEVVGNQLALAFFSIHQERRIQNQLKEAKALAQIERALSQTERVGSETVLQLIVDSARDLIPGAEHAVLHLLDQEQKILVPRAVSGAMTRSTQRLNMRLGEGVAGQVIATGEIISVADTGTDPRFLNLSAPVWFRSLVVAPIESNRQRVGTISVQSKMPNAFALDENRLLGALGIQAAIAIENANLLETTRNDLREIHALYHISRGLAASLDADRLMKDVTNLLQQDFGYYHVQIFTVDPQSGDLVARQGSGKIGGRLKKMKFHLPPGAGIIGHAAEIGEAFVTNDVEQVLFFIRSPLLPDTRSELAVPIKIKGRVLGVLDVQQAPPGRLTRRDLQLMETVTDHLSVALQQANLYAELQTSLRQEKATRSQLIQTERLAVVGRLLASVSHELNNPLQAIQNALFLLKAEKGLSEQGSQDLEIVLSETERMTSLIDRLRSTYRPMRAEDLQAIQLNDIVEDVALLMGTHLRHGNIRLDFLPAENLPVIRCFPDQIRQVVLNLFVNAAEAMPSGGTLTIRTEKPAGEGRVLLSVSDDGAGIPPEILPRVFEPFVTGKDTGTGLGLTISYEIVRQHGGDIQAENNPQGGATFRVWLPVGRKKG